MELHLHQEVGATVPHQQFLAVASLMQAVVGDRQITVAPLAAAAQAAVERGTTMELQHRARPTQAVVVAAAQTRVLPTA
jgi:hypothetical protein